MNSDFWYCNRILFTISFFCFQLKLFDILQLEWCSQNRYDTIDVQTIMGVTLAGLAEGMALADRAGLQQKDVMEVK